VHGWFHRLNNPKQERLFSAHIVHLDLIRRRLELESIQNAFEELRKYAIHLRQQGATNNQIRLAVQHSIRSLQDSADHNDLRLEFDIERKHFLKSAFPKH